MKHQIKVKAKKFHDFIINMEKTKKEKKRKRKGRIHKLMKTVANSTDALSYSPYVPLRPYNSGLSQSHQIITGMNEINQRLNNLNREPSTIPIIKEEALKTPMKNISDSNFPNSSIPLRQFENMDFPIKSSYSDHEMEKPEELEFRL